MNTDKNDYFDFIEDENPIQIKQIIGKYLRYWPWFLGMVLVSLFIASVYLRYADVIYKTSSYYNAADEASFHWNDPQLAISWPATPQLLSAKDAAAPDFTAALA